MRWFAILKEKLTRSVSYAKFGWDNPDWDNYYLHSLVLFKLKRMQHVFIHYGHHSEECENYKPKMRSIEVAIKLLDSAVNDSWWRDEMNSWEKKRLYSFINMKDKKQEKRIQLAYRIINKYHNYWWD